jgi:tRNA-dihydrouridine synthase A
MPTSDRRGQIRGTPAGTSRGKARPLSIAPMMDRTDRHYRYFMRQVTRHTLLYTEMVSAGAVLYGDRDRLLGFSEAEKPVAVQLGGDDPAALMRCAVIAENLGYDEVNLNVGCPSDRVQKGRFGVCLMARPELVAEAVAAMRQAVRVPVTVKHRIGFDGLDRFEDMAGFVRTVARAGCDRFIVHARKAWLQGLSAKENREVPPLRYQDVYRLKAEFPELRVEINGGVNGLPEVRAHLRQVDGVMVGRTAYQDPYLFATADGEIFGDPTPPPSRRKVVEALIPYLEDRLGEGVPLGRMTRPLVGLLAGQPGARAWRRYLSENAYRPGAGAEVLQGAMDRVPAEVLDAAPGRRAGIRESAVAT